MRVTSYCVGELSALDVGVLIGLARQSHRVLEFGAGGSTTLWAQFCPPSGIVVCVETVPEWSARTVEMLRRLGVGADPQVHFADLDTWRDHLDRSGPQFDLVFIDGGTDRTRVAEETWPLLMPGGCMAWHDTHRVVDGARVFQFLAQHHLEVSAVRCESAITVATKCVERNIGDVDAFEKREPWESGHAPLPADWPRY